MIDQPNPKKRGGLRSPAGGRPPLPEGERKVKVSITISQDSLNKAHRAYPNEPLSQIVERLLQGLSDTPEPH